MAHKKKIIKCFVCGTEWTAGEDEAHASTLKCPHCNINDFSGNFIIKEKEEKTESRFKPQWGQPTGEKKESDTVVFVEAEPKAASSSSETTEHKSQHKTEFGGATASKRTQAIFLESGKSDAANSSGGGEGRVYEYIKESEKTGSERPTVVVNVIEKKNEPTSISKEITSGCFIVTATYGTGSYDRIAIFYRFRDEFLLKSTPGRLFTQAYYRLSPYPAAAVKRSKTLKTASRVFLDRLAAIISRLL